MSALLIILFLALVGGIYVTVGRTVVPRQLRRPLSDDLWPAFTRGVRAMYNATGVYVVDRAADEAPLRTDDENPGRTRETAGASR